MADQKLTALTAIAAATVDDILYLVEDPLVTPLSRKITFDNFQKSITDVGIIATGTWSAGFGLNVINDTHIDWGVGANQVSAVDIPIADAGSIITGTEVETALQENRTAIDLNTLKDTNVSTDLSLGDLAATTMNVNSSDGTNATLIEADTTNAGLLGSDKWDEIVANSLKVTYDDAGTVAANAAHVAGDGSDHTDVAANTLKETNVSTSLSVGTVTANTVAITSDGGADDVIIPAATPIAAGCLTTSVITDIVLNNAKETNVTTNLSLGAGNATTEVVACSDGTDCTLIEADTDNAGLLGADKWDEIVANTAAKHTQNTDTALGSGCVAADHGTAATDQVINICYGTGDPPAANTTTEGALFVKYTA